MPQRTLDQTDHAILLFLIRGLDINEAAAAVQMGRSAVRSRIIRMKNVTETQTVYQLVALEMANLMCSEEPIPAIELKGKAANA